MISLKCSHDSKPQQLIINNMYGTNYLQLKQYTSVTCVLHVCDMRGVNHAHVGLQIAHTSVHAHPVFNHTHVFTCVHACMANIAGQLASYLPFTLSYTATILVTLFFLYRVLSAHQGVFASDGKQIENGEALHKRN